LQSILPPNFISGQKQECALFLRAGFDPLKDRNRQFVIDLTWRDPNESFSSPLSIRGHAYRSVYLVASSSSSSSAFSARFLPQLVLVPAGAVALCLLHLPGFRHFVSLHGVLRNPDGQDSRHSLAKNR